MLPFFCIYMSICIINPDNEFGLRINEALLYRYIENNDFTLFLKNTQKAKMDSIHLAIYAHCCRSKSSMWYRVTLLNVSPHELLKTLHVLFSYAKNVSKYHGGDIMRSEHEYFRVSSQKNFGWMSFTWNLKRIYHVKVFFFCKTKCIYCHFSSKNVL